MTFDSANEPVEYLKPFVCHIVNIVPNIFIRTVPILYIIIACTIINY